MRKVLCALVVIAYCPLFWNPAFGQSQGVGMGGVQKPNHRTSGKTADTESDQRGTYNRPLVVDTEGHKKSDQEATEAKADKDRRDYSERWTLYYAGAAAVGTIGLVIVGAIAAVFANRTLSAIERQGDFLREQVILMQAPHRQWVQLQKWRTHFDSHTEQLLIQVDLINPTDFPVSVFGSMTVKTSSPGGYSIGDPLFLPPDSPNTIEVLAYLRDDEIERFNSDVLSVEVSGRFSHTGFVYKRTLADQEFRGWLECGKSKQPQFRYGVAPMTPEYY